MVVHTGVASNIFLLFWVGLNFTALQQATGHSAAAAHACGISLFMPAALCCKEVGDIGKSTKQSGKRSCAVFSVTVPVAPGATYLCLVSLVRLCTV
jgi:hypothetical protein